MTCRLPRLAFGVSTSSTCEVTTAMPPPEIRATTVWPSNAQNRSIIAGFIGCFELASVLSKSKPNTWRWSRHYRNQVRATNVPPCRASLVDECSTANEPILTHVASAMPYGGNHASATWNARIYRNPPRSRTRTRCSDTVCPVTALAPACSTIWWRPRFAGSAKRGRN